MLYHVFQYLEQNSNIPGAGLFAFISFRAGMAIIVSLLISVVFGGSIVNYLRRKQVGETVRDLGLEGQMSKQGTPTMGGIMILASILIPTLLFADLTNIYILLMLLVTVFMGMIGFLDDYIKVFRKNKEGLRGRFKILGQVVLGLIVGLVIMFHPDVQIRDFNKYYVYEMDAEGERMGEPIQVLKADSTLFGGSQEVNGFIYSHDVRSTKTTIPLIKNNEFNYESLVNWLPAGTQAWVFPILFIGIMIFIITAVSNGANLTDGLDGLATGTSAVIVFTLLLFAYVSGNSILADYLNIMYIPRSGELVVFSAAFVGACVGFLWWNAYPAQVFMGDTGSLAIGGIIATLAIAIRKELLIPILCGVFLAEVVSVIIQTQWFKYTRIKFGEGRRVFKMAPLHHHYQKLGFPETKIVIRFWIIGIVLAIISIVTLKIR